MDKLFEGIALLGDYSEKIKDQVLAQGELLSVKLIAGLLEENNIKAHAVDARTLIKTDENFGNALPLTQLSKQNVIEHFKKYNGSTVNIVTGFIASNSKNETTLYGLLVSLGRQLGLNEKELPTTGLAISEVFKRLLNRIREEKLNAVFVIDEIDYLAQLVVKTGKDILYQLTRANEQLEVGSLTMVGISNDLTFKEKLDPRVISSLGEEEIVFTNYNVEQIKKILEERINESFIENAIEDPALNLCAALAGGEHGDARRAIDLLRVAGELAERQQSDKVTIEHVREASLKIEENKEEASLKSYPLHEKLVLLAIMKANGSSTGEIYSSYKNLCKTVGKDGLTQRRVTQMLSEIELSGIISGRLIHQGIHGRTKKYKLTVSSEMIKKSFKDELTLQDII